MPKKKDPHEVLKEVRDILEKFLVGTWIQSEGRLGGVGQILTVTCDTGVPQYLVQWEGAPGPVENSYWQLEQWTHVVCKHCHLAKKEHADNERCLYSPTIYEE